MITRKQIKKCPVHSQIRDKIIEELADNSYFNKDDILRRLELTAFTDAIHWAFLIELVEEIVGYRLTPLTQTFFKIEKDKNKKTSMNRFIATGHGKRCHGYASADLANGILEKHRIQWKKNQINGQANKVNDQVDKLEIQTKIQIPKLSVIEEKLQIENKKEVA